MASEICAVSVAANTQVDCAMPESVSGLLQSGGRSRQGGGEQHTVGHTRFSGFGAPAAFAGEVPRMSDKSLKVR